MSYRPAGLGQQVFFIVFKVKVTGRPDQPFSEVHVKSLYEPTSYLFALFFLIQACKYVDSLRKAV